MKPRPLSPNQVTLLRAATKYAIMDDWNRREFYQLGGHGYVPIRYSRDTMLALVNRGFVTSGSAATATEAGKRHLAEIDAIST